MNENDGVGADRNRRASCVGERYGEEGQQQHEPDEPELGERLEIERVRIERAAARVDEA
jgi:hypothetical protein